MTTKLWASDDADLWHAALDRYGTVVGAQGVARLDALDHWYRADLPPAIEGRNVPHVVHDELVKATEWKMARGVWRARNLVLVRGNAPDAVIEASTEALAAIPDPRVPIARLAALDGVGPATASAIAAAAAPEIYPFFDELVAKQVPGLGPVAFTLPYYLRYAQAIRDRAGALGGAWTPVAIERALWANAGGKAGALA